MTEMREDTRIPGALIHISSFVDDVARIGPGTDMRHFSHIVPGAVVGEDSSIGRNIMFGPRLVVSDGRKIQNDVALYEGVELAEDVFCGPSCVLTNVHIPRVDVTRKDDFRRPQLDAAPPSAPTQRSYAGMRWASAASSAQAQLQTLTSPLSTSSWGVSPAAPAE